MSTDDSPAPGGGWLLGDRVVARIGLGAMRLTGHAAFGDGPGRDLDQATAVVRRAVELGVTHFDTAAFYFSPDLSANRVIAAALTSADTARVTVATKVGPSRNPAGDWLPFPRPDQLRGQVEHNLRELRRDTLDLVYLRMTSRGPLTDHFGALSELCTAGLIRRLGVSNIDARQLAEALALTTVAAVQNRYAPDSRSADADTVLETCARERIAFVPFFTLAGPGREAGDPPAQPERIRAVADAHGATPAQVRIAWALHRGPHVLPIPGTGRLDHLQENLAAGALHLSEDDMATLAAEADPSAR